MSAPDSVGAAAYMTPAPAMTTAAVTGMATAVTPAVATVTAAMAAAVTSTRVSDDS